MPNPRNLRAFTLRRALLCHLRYSRKSPTADHTRSGFLSARQRSKRNKVVLMMTTVDGGGYERSGRGFARQGIKGVESGASFDRWSQRQRTMTIPVVRQRAKKPKTYVESIFLRRKEAGLTFVVCHRRTGCRTCRPECMRCATTSRTCGGYEVSVASLHGVYRDRALLLLPKTTQAQTILRSPPSVPTALDAMEVNAIDFFRRHTASQLPGYSWELAWERLVLQSGFTNPAILHAAIAVGSLHQARNGEQRMSLRTEIDALRHGFAIAQYNKAMAHVRTIINDLASGESSDAKIQVVLVVCLLFVCFELLQGGGGEASLHLRIGMRILYDRVARGPVVTEQRHVTLRHAPRSETDVLLLNFARLDADLTLCGERTPFLQPVCGLDLPISFSSLVEAQVHLDALASAVYHTRAELSALARARLKQDPRFHTLTEIQLYVLSNAMSRITPLDGENALRARMRSVLKSLTAWLSALAFISQPTEPEEARTHLLIQCQFFFVWFTASTWRDRTEFLSDRFEEQFKHLITLAEQYVELHPRQPMGTDDDTTTRPAIMLNAGISACLGIVAAKCRTSKIRRRAVSLLHRLNTLGVLDSWIMAVVLQRVVDFEESKAMEILGSDGLEPGDLQCHQVPEEARFFNVTLTGDTDPNAGCLVGAKLQHDQAGALALVERKFSVATAGKGAEKVVVSIPMDERTTVGS
nr:hypothetical protein CFP56_64559 [Quercus suber]